MSVNVAIHNIETIVESTPTRRQNMSKESYVRVIEFRDKDGKVVFDVSMFADEPQKLVIQGK